MTNTGTETKNTMDSKKEQKAWREVKYSQKFLNAFRGMYVVGKTTRHFFIHITVALVVIISAFCFHVSSIEWMMLVFAIGFVIVSEVFNTAIEIDIDLTSPEYHPYARDTKDVAAAAVLLSVFVAVIIGLIIFLPKIL
jgi:diacylglycerol kinase